MANNTWFGATNEVLELAQLDAIPNAAAFNTPTNNLSKYQRAARAYIRLAQMHLSVKAYKHFATRRIPLTIDANSNSVFALDLGINPEHIKPRTFFNVSSGTLANQNRELRHWEYEEFRTAYPNPSQITSGPPERWIILPIERTDTSPIHKVRIYPNPDQIYNLEYQAALNAYSLTTATDTLLWPPEYEFVLWEFAWELLERGLGEGKEGSIAKMAEEAANQVRLVSGRAADQRRRFRTMSLGFRRSDRYIRSPQSIDANGSVID